MAGCCENVLHSMGIQSFPVNVSSTAQSYDLFKQHRDKLK